VVTIFRRCTALGRTRPAGVRSSRPSSPPAGDVPLSDRPEDDRARRPAMRTSCVAPG